MIDYYGVLEKLKGAMISKPLSGTLSDYAAGEPFDKHVYNEIKKIMPNHTFRQYDYLNDLYRKNPEVIGVEARRALFDSPTDLFLLNRGKNATDKWSIETPFDEKQNDTADILVVKDGMYEIIDIKTRNLSKAAQPPNIISAFKLAQVCAKMLENREFNSFAIYYLSVDWLLEAEKLVCKDAHFASLFKTNPYTLYINWAAAMQIQFHVSELEQSFEGDMAQWAKAYLKHFVTQARKRSEDMIEKFVKPFGKYLEADA